jgi:transcriptional regulator with XRE-family HTH domain
VLTAATLKAAEWMGLSQAQLARVIGVSAPTVTRMKSGAYLLAETRKEWPLAALLVRLYRSLDSIVGGRQSDARAWLFGANRAFDGAVPAELIVDVRGLVHVTDYLDAARGPV